MGDTSSSNDSIEVLSGPPSITSRRQPGGVSSRGLSHQSGATSGASHRFVSSGHRFSALPLWETEGFDRSSGSSFNFGTASEGGSSADLYLTDDVAFYSCIPFLRHTVRMASENSSTGVAVITDPIETNVLAHRINWLAEKARDPYFWVHEDPKTIVSWYAEDAADVTIEDVVVHTDVEHENDFTVFCPQTSDRICHQPGSRNLFMYEMVFSKIGVRLPLTEFEMGVLQFLDCAPSQLHPNGWGLVRSLEVLGEYFHFVPTVALFFTYCRVMRRGNSGGGLGFINLRCDSKVVNFESYTESAKTDRVSFKHSYVKVEVNAGRPVFWENSDFSRKFYTGWTHEHFLLTSNAYIVSESTLSTESKKVLDALKGYSVIAKFSCKRLLGTESGRDAYLGEMARIDILRKLREAAEARNAVAAAQENRVTPRRTPAKMVSIPAENVGAMNLGPAERVPIKRKSHPGTTSRSKKHKAPTVVAEVEVPREEEAGPVNISPVRSQPEDIVVNSRLSDFLEYVGGTPARVHIPFKLKADLPASEAQSTAEAAIFNLVEAAGVLSSLGRSYYSGVEAKECLDRMKKAEALRVEAQTALTQKEQELAKSKEDLSELAAAYTSAAKRADAAEAKAKASEDALQALRTELDEAKAAKAEVDEKNKELSGKLVDVQEEQAKERMEAEEQMAEFSVLADVAFSSAVRQVVHRNSAVQLNLNGIGVYYEFHGGHLYAMDRGQASEPEDIPYELMPLPEGQSMELRTVSEESERTASARPDSPAPNS
ncbi:hypothetical protein RJT34_12856 [Clitoria ternatea]|uniref:Uncharacterized protein n=1 Tax=Clitoria ternatea TaxID=43366 RepID=A0AAN9JPM4_CLITE